MEHRPASVSDIDRIMEIIADAQRFLKSNGVDQWQNGYPTREIFAKDIEQGACHVFLADGAVAGVISVFFGTEESYNEVESGKWLTADATYAMFHRAAVGDEYRGMGIASRMLSFAENMALVYTSAK